MTPSSDKIEASRRRLERAKNNTLVETNAQAISETLRQLRAARDIHRRRWIWELIQNAADATDEAKGKNRIEIEISTRSLIFQHDGSPFDENELSHLIYHGSTKQADPKKKGKFGSGFITIHLIAEKVRIEGVLKEEDGSLAEFRFNLDRSGATAAEIQDRMETAWTECLGSITGTVADVRFSTSFECELDEQAKATVSTGLNELEHVAPYVLALVDELDEISVVSPDGCVRWHKANQERSGSVLYSDVLKESSHGIETHRIATIGDYSTSTAVVVALHKEGGRWCLAVEADVPRLFYPLPLVGTETLPLPFAIVSSKFEPTTPRNGILAGPNIESSVPTAKNWELLSDVASLYELLVEASLSHDWSNAYVLASVKVVPPREWLDEKRFTQDILLKLIAFLRASKGPKLIPTLGGNNSAFAETQLPVGPNAEAIYHLASELAFIKDRLPSKPLTNEMNHILSGWASVLGKKVEELSEALTAEGLGRELASKCTTLADLDKVLVPPDSGRSIEWLKELTERLPDQQLEPFLRTYAILPDQKGRLRKSSELRLDGDVDEELKDICEEIGEEVRSELLHARASQKAKALFQGLKGRVLSNEDCLERALKKIAEHAREDKRQYVAGNAKLLRWLVGKQRIDKIAGYPAFAADGIRLLRKAEPILIPSVLWDEAARPFSDVFPANRRLDDSYGCHLSDEHWLYLKDAGVLLQSLFFTEEVEGLESFQVEGALDDNVEHKAVPSAKVVQLVFLKGEEGVLTELRKSKSKARRFLEFLLRYVIKAERSWVEEQKSQCTCGTSHQLWPGWLFLVRQHGWVPIGKSKGDRPTPANLAALLDDDLKQHILTDTDSARFLLKLDIGLSDLLRVGVPEAKRFQVDQLSAKIYDSEDATIESIEAVLADPLIREVVLHKKQEKETVDRNQKVGKLIEDLLRKELEAEKITVRRRPIGSDFEIESDFIEDQQEQLLEFGPHLLEVKSTSTPYVRMTLRQGIEACKEENKHRYVLCVVPLVQDPMDEEAVRLNSKFVLGIGSLLEAKVNAAGDLKQLEKNITPSRGEVVEIDMVQSQIKLRIAQPVWQSAKTFTFRQFVDYLRPRKTESPTV